MVEAETGISDQATESFEETDASWSFWGEGDVSCSKIENITNFKFKINVSLVSIYDKDEKDITEQYIRSIAPASSPMINGKRSFLNSNTNGSNVEPPRKRQRVSDENGNEDIDIFFKIQQEKSHKLFQEQQNWMKSKTATMNKENEELKAKLKDNNKLKEENTKLTIKNKELISKLENFERLKQQNIKLNKENKEYKGTIKRLEHFDIGNLNELNNEKLKELEIKMTENVKKIREKRDQIKENESLCILCYENKKCIVIQGCNHLDICEQCKDNLPSKKCPRCQKLFKKTLKLNHLNV